MVRDYWYAIELSKNIGNHPLGIRRFGKNWVLWRDSEGKVVCLPDRCPHRGARLSQGKLIGRDCIQCPLHGFRYDTEGACTLLPALGKGSTPPSTLKLSPQVVREENELVWMWWGAPREELPPIPWFDELTEAALPYVELARDTPVAFCRFMEGNLDFAHFEFVHSRALNPKGLGPRAEDIQVTFDGDMIRIQGVLRPDNTRPRDEAPGVAFSGAVRFPGIATYEIPPKSKLFGVVVASPVDESTTWFVIRSSLKKGPLLGVRRWLQDRVFMRGVFNKIIHPQDLRLILNQEPATTGLDVDVLASPLDQPIARYLRLWRQALERDGLGSAAQEDADPNALGSRHSRPVVRSEKDRRRVG